VKLLGAALGILFGLVVGAALIHAVLPTARAREERYRLSQARASCQVLLIGPSYANMVLPADFDAEARRIGLDKRLCKLARAGMVGFELKREIDFALSQDWKQLELVLVDTTLGESPGFSEGNWFKSRAVEWHTVAGMKWLLEYYRANPKRSPELRVWVAHARHLLSHYASLGRAPELVGWREPLKTTTARLRDKAERKAREQREQSAKKSKDDAKPRRAEKKKKRSDPEPRKSRLAKAESRKSKAEKAGVQEATATEGARAQRRLRQHLARVAELVETNRTRKQTPRYGGDAWVRQLRDQVRSYGHEAFFVHAPVYYGPRVPLASAQGKDRIVLLRFNDPERFPELYQLSSRGTTNHLSKSAKPIYSRLLANELLTHWKRR
jgi:hypothetical protein